LGTSVAEVARACELNPNRLPRCRRERRENGDGRCGIASAAGEESRPSELEGKIGQQASEIDLLQAACSGSKRSGTAGANWKAAVYEQIEQEMKTGSHLTRRRMCQLGQVSRARLCRYGQTAEPADRDMELRDALQPASGGGPATASAGITAELRRRSWRVNHKRVRRLMHQDNLLWLRCRGFVLTSDSDHRLGVYPNWTRQLIPLILTSFGLPLSFVSGWHWSLCIWQSSWMPSRAAPSAGRLIAP
jgi:helix-turn-helix protein